jgi:signal transduction protein with GAF and PtsI domain
VEYNGLVNRQLEDLSESRRQTEQAFEQLRQKYTERNMTNFIDGSSVLIQNLSNLSIDINHIFNDDQDETLWKKFYSGDYQAFARHIVKNMTRKQIVRLRDEYEKNEDFRQMADRYLSEFETLLQSAKSSERPQVMMALLSGSDLGKVYYIMARALDRLG